MNARRQDLPPPDMTGTDPGEVRRARFQLGTNPLATSPAAPAPVVETSTGTPEAPIPAHTRPQPPAPATKPKVGTRPDAEGMARVSYYVSKDAEAAVDDAVSRILTVLGDDVPKHLAVSRILAAGAAQADAIATELAQARATELAERLAALRNST